MKTVYLAFTNGGTWGRSTAGVSEAVKNANWTTRSGFQFIVCVFHCSDETTVFVDEFGYWQGPNEPVYKSPALGKLDKKIVAEIESHALQLA